MGANFVVAFSLLVAQTTQTDSLPAYSSPTVQHLVERAMARRLAADSAVRDYRARIHYRLTLSSGRSRWAEMPTLAVEEQVAEVRWQRPNQLRLDVVGRRSRSRSDEIQLSSVWDRPWFVPRAVDDSVRIFSDEFPATGALHPLARTGSDWYRYELAEGLSVAPAAGPSLRLLRVDVVPRRTGPALVAGHLWIDSATAEVVRLTFRYVGTGLWVQPKGRQRSDSAAARRTNATANRMVSVNADLEYALQDGRYWMPYRQVIAGRVRLPLASDVVIPFQATTTFDDYEINTGRNIAFTLPLPDSGTVKSKAERRARRDSLRAERRSGDGERSWNVAGTWPGGRYELHRPSNDSLARYAGWTDSLELESDAAEARRIRQAEVELARMSETLPDSLTGEARHGIAYERLADAVRYNRVQGLSFGLGYQVRVPGVRFTGLYGTVRYGLSDDRITGRLTLLRDAPGGRLAVSGYRDIADLDPLSPGQNFGNSLNALLAAHDNADYALVDGGSVAFETSLATGLDLGIGARVERQTSVATVAQSEVNDFLGGSGVFPPNQPVDEGTYGGGWIRVSDLLGTRWRVTADALGGEGRTTGRLFGELRHDVGGGRGATLRVKGGIATRPTLQQSLFRLGGLNTVRGFDYGSRRGSAFWAAQLDLSPLKGKLRPIVFVDAGQAEVPSRLFSSKALVGGGVGLSVVGNFARIRLDLSHPLSPDSDDKLRFDLVLQSVR